MNAVTEMANKMPHRRDGAYYRVSFKNRTGSYINIYSKRGITGYFQGMSYFFNVQKSIILIRVYIMGMVHIMSILKNHSRAYFRGNILSSD